jgi:hypothetical protein
MNQSTSTARSPLGEETNFVLGFLGVRYQVGDVSRSIEFYTRQLGFKLDHKHLPAQCPMAVDRSLVDGIA